MNDSKEWTNLESKIKDTKTLANESLLYYSGDIY